MDKEKGYYTSSISLALDSHGHPHISYVRYRLLRPSCREARSLKYAAWDGQRWEVQTVIDEVEEPMVNISASLALDSEGFAHIAYSGAGNRELRYATNLPEALRPIGRARKRVSRLFWEAYPIRDAAGQGDVARVRQLLDAGTEVDIRDSMGRSPLHWAAEQDHREVAALLVERGAQLDAQDREGDTPLLLALERDHTEVARLLLKAGADVSIQNSYGRRPLHQAVHDGRLGLVKLLIEHGADVTAANEDGRTPLHQVTDKCWGPGGETAGLLLKAGADINAQDNSHRTPLDLAAPGGKVAEVLRRHAEGSRRTHNRRECCISQALRPDPRIHDLVPSCSSSLCWTSCSASRLSCSVQSSAILALSASMAWRYSWICSVCAFDYCSNLCTCSAVLTFCASTTPRASCPDGSPTATKGRDSTGRFLDSLVTYSERAALSSR